MHRKTTALAIVLAAVIGQASRTYAQSPRTVTVSARGEVRVAPDLAELSLGVVTQSARLSDAKSENDKKTAAILALAKKHGIEKDDIQLNVYIAPVYEERKASEIEKLLGYRIHRDIEFRLRDFAKIEPLLSESLAAGANVVRGLEYRFTKHRERQAEVRRLAVEVAKEKAGQLAELNGLILGKATQISEELETDRHFQGPASMPAAPPAALPNKQNGRAPELYFVARQQRPDENKAGKQPAGQNDTTIPFAPGQLAVRITVNITFELQAGGR